MNSLLETRALQAMDETETVELLAGLVRTPSITGTDAETDLQHRSADLLRELDLDIDTWRLDLQSLSTHTDFPGTEAARTEGYGVVGTSEGEGPPALVLQGHVDVVPTGDRADWPDGDPWSARISGDVMHGRGTCDMKAGMAVNLAVMRALRRAQIPLHRPIALHCVISEEDGGLGAFATMQRGHRGDMAVITEPTSRRVVTANAGALTFRLVVPGLAAHGSTRYEGVSALDAFWPVHQAIHALEAERNRDPDPLLDSFPIPYPISIGSVHAGDWASTVPDSLVAEGRLGVRMDECPREARLALEHRVAEACAGHPWLAAHPVEVSWPGGQFASGRLPAGHAALDEMRSAVAAVSASGEMPEVAGAPYGSDLRLYSQAGIPTLHYGPGDVRYAHAVREQVRLAEVFDAARALLVLAVRRCARA